MPGPAGTFAQAASAATATPAPSTRARRRPATRRRVLPPGVVPVVAVLMVPPLSGPVPGVVGTGGPVLVVRGRTRSGCTASHQDPSSGVDVS
ncbi:hypothetical protein AD006_09895 [Pseudonocardia sp. EC080610-09]|nr:hypothetical protein FRP1_02275 [Pseudonocardia sp. EC080625-04]ALL75541.1 hypothetical protein AD006_09895 [Pseudonocardia sp. EC080610-09]ALL82568.1 hypothetical protein AD017_17725 [Pseudonocardia sp. EC080619-01]